MNSKTKSLATLGILAAIIFILGMTPVGIIPLGFINLTIVHIPVIVGAMVLRPKQSLVLGGIFGLASTLAAFGMSMAAQSSLALMILAHSPLAVIVMCIIPRLIIPITTKITYNAMCKLQGINYHSINKKAHRRAITTAAIVGSLTNTVLYLGFMGIFFAMYNMWNNYIGIFSTVLFIGATCEAIAAALISNAVVPAIIIPRKKDFELYDSTAGTDNQDEKPADEFDSSIDEFSVAVIPSTDSFLPAMDEMNTKRHDRCMQYLNEGNMIMANHAFDALAHSLKNDTLEWNIYLYAIMRFIESSKYESASQRLTALLRSNLAPHMLNSDNKHIILGLMNIIHTSVVSDAQNPIAAQAADKIFTEATDSVIAERCEDAAKCFAEYISEIGAKDKTIKIFDDTSSPYPSASEATEYAPESAFLIRELNESDESTEEGISASDVAVIPTAASIELPSDIDFSSAIKMLEMNSDSTELFEKTVANIENDELRIEADRFVMLTYFEHGDYVQALRAIIRCLKRNYSNDFFAKPDIKSTIMGILTIIHSSIRAINSDNKNNADHMIKKFTDFYEKGIIPLSAQILEKYFISTGLAK